MAPLLSEVIRFPTADKGPMIRALLAMKALREAGPARTSTIRRLVGSDEESTNIDITDYLKANRPPDFSLVLDSAFPVVVGEKAWNALTLATRRPTVPRRTVPIRATLKRYGPALEARLRQVVAGFAAARRATLSFGGFSRGGTYAKRMPHAIAFGMWFPGRPYPGHDVDEQVPIEDLHRGVHALIETLADLACGEPLKEPFTP
jgi:acetylornithine deacetylase/succinyl-diaminopimelate desuccinylase-like protein